MSFAWDDASQSVRKSSTSRSCACVSGRRPAAASGADGAIGGMLVGTLAGTGAGAGAEAGAGAGAAAFVAGGAALTGDSGRGAGAGEAFATLVFAESRQLTTPKIAAAIAAPTASIANTTTATSTGE